MDEESIKELTFREEFSFFNELKEVIQEEKRKKEKRPIHIFCELKIPDSLKARILSETSFYNHQVPIIFDDEKQGELSSPPLFKESLIIDKPRIITGDIEANCRIVLDSVLIVIGNVKGMIEFKSENALLYYSKLLDARIYTRSGFTVVSKSKPGCLSLKEALKWPVQS